MDDNDNMAALMGARAQCEDNTTDDVRSSDSGEGGTGASCTLPVNQNLCNALHAKLREIMGNVHSLATRPMWFVQKYPLTGCLLLGIPPENACHIAA